VNRKATIPDRARSGGLMIFAPSGWGKSRLLGRRICYQDTMRGTGQVVIDRVGGTIDNLLDKVLYLPRDKQLEVGSRLIYCNMAGQSGYVTLWPMLQRRHQEESLYQTSERVVKLLSQIDENFANATIQGLTRSAPLLRSVCQVLTAHALPITMADPILVSPKAHVDLMHLAAERNPEAREAAADLQAFASVTPRERDIRSEPLRNRLSVLKHDLQTRAMFGTPRPPVISWEEVVQKGQTVLIDLRHEVSDFALNVKLFWVWNSILEYIQSRGAAGHSLPPLSVVIDELSFFTQGTNLNTKEIVKDFREIVFARKRNANIWLTCATQEMRELPQELQTACLSMGSLMFGATIDEETALMLSRRFDAIDPYKLKDSRTIWGFRPEGNSIDPNAPRTYGITGEQRIFFNFDEQRVMNSEKYLNLPKEDWFFARARYEGHVPRTLTRITTRNLDPGQFINHTFGEEDLLEKLKTRLMTRNGAKVEDVIQELEDPSKKQDPPSDSEQIGGSTPTDSQKRPKSKLGRKWEKITNAFRSLIDKLFHSRKNSSVRRLYIFF